MSQVFNANVLVPRAVPDPATDHKLPVPGSLNYGGITSQSAVSGLSGVETALIKGDRQWLTQGNESVKITLDRNATVTGNQAEKVAGNQTQTVIGNQLDTTMGNLNRSVIGATNDVYVGKHTVEHKADQLVSEPTSFMHRVESFIERNSEHHDIYKSLWVSAYVAVNVMGLNVDLRVTQAAAMVAQAEVCPVSTAERAIDHKISALDAKIDAVKEEVGAIEPVVKITHLHEVAVTQKILIIGVNQFM